MSIPDLISALLVPIVGIIVDRTGYRLRVLILAASLMMAVHLYFAQATETSPRPFFFLCILGFSYSFLVTTWSLVPLIVERASAFGVATSCLNISLVIFPIIVASLQPNYFYVELFFAGMSFMGGLCCCLLFYQNSRFQMGLESVSTENSYIKLDTI